MDGTSAETSRDIASVPCSLNTASPQPTHSRPFHLWMPFAFPGAIAFQTGKAFENNCLRSLNFFERTQKDRHHTAHMRWLSRLPPVVYNILLITNALSALGILLIPKSICRGSASYAKFSEWRASISIKPFFATDPLSTEGLKACEAFEQLPVLLC